MSTPGMGARALHGFEAEPTPSPWLTKAEAASYMRVEPRTIDRWVAAGRLTRHRVEGIQSVRFARAELDALLVAEAPTS